jgi:hypothetical protein
MCINLSVEFRAYFLLTFARIYFVYLPIAICTLGFKQKEGTLHFRTTFLPAEDEMEDALERLGEFHRQFFNTYR